MSMAVQNTDSQQTQVKRAKAFVASWVPAGALAGAGAGYHFAKPWMKGGHVSDSFVKEATKQFYKDLPEMSQRVPAPSTIIDTLSKQELKDALEGCFKDLKKGTAKSKEELKGLETHFGDLVEKAVKSMKKSSAIKWGAIGAGIATLSAIFAMKLLNKANVNANKEVKELK